jgi:uncharacterized iron-regulated protein
MPIKMYRTQLKFVSILASYLFLWLDCPILHAQEERWSYPSLEFSHSIRDGKTTQRLDWDQLIAQLKEADIIFLGESHDDDTTHRFQLAVYDAMLNARGGKVVLAMEMFERDVQPHLDDYLAGKIDESTFLSKSRPWGNYREAYRPLVERAKGVGQPVIASNFPRPLLMKLAQSGDLGLEGLGSKERALIPEKLLPNSDLYWKRADNATRSHSQFMAVKTDEQSRLTSTQSLWDNSMGEACVKALVRYPGYQVIHLNGGFHTEYWDGTAGQVRQRNPEAIIKTVAIRPSARPSSAQLLGAPSADFVVWVEDRAKNLNDGDWKVTVAREQPYRIHVPEWSSPERPAPLFIWLTDDGLTAEENLHYWKSVLGDQAAILVPEATHRQLERDLSLGGRWFWQDRFPHDIAVGSQTVEAAWQYALNRFSLDPHRVCLAGQGTGATLSTAVALMTSKMDVEVLVFSPRQFAKIKDFPLPLKEDWGDEVPPTRSLKVFGHEPDETWWSGELKEYGSVGISTQWNTVESDPWKAEHQKWDAIRTALHLPAIQTEWTSIKKKYLKSKFGTVKEELWLRNFALQLSDNQTLVTVVPPAMSVEEDKAEPVDYQFDFQQIQKRHLPLCPGSFGGTTVLVLSADRQHDLEKWLQLESDDPLTRRSRFHRTRIAIENSPSLAAEYSDRSLPEVVGKLLKENRKNILIVPAEFYAGPDRMAKLAESVEAFKEQLTLHWLQGLGGEAKGK